MIQSNDYTFAYVGPSDDIIRNSSQTIASILRVNHQIMSGTTCEHYQYTYDTSTGNLLIMFNIAQDRLFTHHDEYFILEDVPGDNVHIHLTDEVITNPSASANRIVQQLRKLIGEDGYDGEVTSFYGERIADRLLPR